MSTLYPPLAHLDAATMASVVVDTGTGLLFLGNGAHIAFTSPLDARLMAVRLSELASAMEAAQRPEVAA